MLPVIANRRAFAQIGRFTLVSILVLTGFSTPPPSTFASSSESTCAPGSGTASIAGTVTTSAAGPAANVLVTAYTEYGDRGGYDYTDAAGAYQVTGLIGGVYILEYRPQSGGDATGWSGDQAGPTTATTVTVSTGGATTGIDIQLNAGGQIRGHLTGVGAADLASVRVDVYNSLDQYVAGGYSDATGVYTTSPGLPSGGYRVSFSGAYTYLDEHYHDRPDRESADVVTVTAPTLLDNIDAQLEPGGVITGVVTSASTGLPLPSISVYASGDGGSDQDYTDSNGLYELVGLGSGTYGVEARPTFDENLISTPQTATVTVPAATTGVDFSMTEGGTLTGQVTAPGGTPLDNITVYVGGITVDYGNYVSTDATGTYTATGLPSGDYYVHFRPSDDYVSEVYNDRDPEGDARDLVSVTAPGTVTGIDAELAPGSKIMGTVTEEGTGSPIKDVFVEVLALDGGRVETDFTAADGTYETPSTLAPGTYKVIFNADERFASCTYVTEYYAGAYDLDTAGIVHVGAAATVTGIDASMLRGSIVFGRVTQAGTGAAVTYGGVNIQDPSGQHVAFGRLTFLGGYHTATGLRSGAYSVFFHDNGSGWIDEYYNDRLTRATADPVIVAAPVDLYGIDAQLERGGLIAGLVTEARTGLPFDDGYVEVLDGSGTAVGWGEILPDGTYVVPDGLPGGAYRVVVRPYGQDESGGGSPYIPSFYRGSVMPGAPLPVPVTAPDTTAGIDIAVLNGAFLPRIER